MLKRVFVICFSMWCGFGKAQNNKIADSLKRILDVHVKADTGRVKLMMDYSSSVFRTDPGAAFIYATKADELAQQLKWEPGRGMSLMNLSDLYSYSSRYDSAVAIALEALTIAERTDDKNLSARIHAALGGNYRLMATNDTLAEEHLKKYLSIAASINNQIMVLDALVQLSTLYDDMRLPEKEAPITDSALKMAVAQKNESSMARLTEIKANRQFSQKKYAEAVNGFRQALMLWENEKNDGAIAYVQCNLSMVFLDWQKKDSAAFYAYAALKTAKQFGLKKELADSYDVLFTYHKQYGEYKKALDYRLLYDSMYNETYNAEVTQRTERARIQYEQAKKDALADVEQAKKDAAATRTRNILYTLVGVFVLIVLFLLYNNRQKQQAKTAIEAAYTKLKETQVQLIQSEKMASLGELTAGIAHEIQNPLNFVNNFSEVSRELLDEMKAELEIGNTDNAMEMATDVDQNLEKILHHGKRADAIVKGMLQHSRISSGKKEPTDINALADEYLRLAYHGLRAKDKTFNATLKTDYDDSIGYINIIPQDIGRVILNLINNAFYAVDEKKKQQHEKYEPTVSITTKRKNNKVEISVADNGNGISANIVNKIFQPFFTTKPSGQGTGLGLSLSYDVIKAHGGEMSVNSKEGEGAAFTIILGKTTENL